MPSASLAAATAVDWIIIAGYLALIAAAGIILARREPSGAGEYFIANRRMPVWAVVCSIVASALSVATFLGAPDESFRGDLTYLSTNIGGILAVFVIAWFFIPAFYRADCVSIYEILEHRLGAGAKNAASGAFMVGRVFASGVRLYMAAIPLCAIIFGLTGVDDTGSLILAIALLSAVAVLLTLVGGIASVIWTDVIQSVVMLAAVTCAIVSLYARIPASGEQVLSAWQTGGADGASKLTLLKLGVPFDPAEKYTLLTAVLGFSLLGLAAYGTDHDMVQRMLTCRSAVKGGRSALIATVVMVPVVALFMLVGLLLWVFYTRPDLMGEAMPPAERIPDLAKNQQPFLWFIVNEIPSGLRGVMIAGIFAVGIGSLNSAINAMAATFVKDFYMRWRPARDDRHYLLAGRWAVVGWGVVLAAFAVLCIFWKRASPDTSLIPFALSIMSYAYSGLLAIFLTALFTRRGNSASAVAALITGFCVVLAFNKAFWGIGTQSEDALNALLKAWPHFTLAFPWQLLIATAAAFCICIVPRRRETRT